MGKKGTTKKYILDIMEAKGEATLTDIKYELNKDYNLDLNKSTLFKHIKSLSDEIYKKKDDYYGKRVLYIYKLKDKERKERDIRYNIPSITIRIDEDKK